MTTRTDFPTEPIDGRVRHRHRRYDGIDHGCACSAMYHERDCAAHAHDGVGHLIDIGADCGIVYGPAQAESSG